MNMSEASKLKDNLHKQCQELSNPAKTAFLLKLIESTPKDNYQLFEQISATIWMAQAKSFLSLEQAKKLYRLHAKSLEKLMEMNRKFRAVQKQFEMEFGNYFHSQGMVAEALNAYENAIRSEHNHDKKAHGSLNIARLSLTQGNFFRALQISEHLPIDRMKDNQLIAYNHLLKARILLILGYEQAGVQALNQISRDNISIKIALERNYLLAMSQWSFLDRNESEERFSKFLKWVEGSFEESVFGFYYLELLLLSAVTKTGVRVKQSQMTRARHLATKCKDKTLIQVLNKLMAYKKASFEKSSFLQLKKSMHALHEDHSHRLFQVLIIQLIEFHLNKKMFKKALILMQDFEAYHSNLKANFSSQVKSSLKSMDSKIFKFSSDLKSRVPKDYLKLQENIGLSLVS